MSIYGKLGVKRVINGSFALTRLGGSILADEIQEAMVEANKSYCNIWDLEKRAGEIISEITGAEAGFVTSGTFNALVLSAATCIAGRDYEKIRRLPHTEGMKNEILIQRCNRIPIYDRSMEVPGGKFVEVGDERWGCTPQLLENAITDKTAAIHYLSSPQPHQGSVPLKDVLKIMHSHSIPVIVDAAGMTWPLDGLHKFTDMGCDLVCYGGKYVGGPNSTGFVIGKKDLVDTVALHSFIGNEYGPLGHGNYWRSIGRGYKLDRQEIIAVVVALQRWVKLDHEKVRFKPAWEKVHYMEEGLKDIENVKFSYIPPSGKGCSYHVIGLRLDFEDKSPAEVNALVDSLRRGDPEIWVRGGFGGNGFAINTLNLVDGEEEIIVERFKEIIG